MLAEGAESEGQVRTLRAHGCDAVQGYFYSRPLPAEECERGLRGDRWQNAEDDARSDSEPAVLVVDDEPGVCNALRRALHGSGCRVLSASGAREDLELLALHEIAVVVSDQCMPEMSGTEFLGRVKDLHPDVVRIMLSGYTELDAVTGAINRGAVSKFFTKPWDDDDLSRTILGALRDWQQRQQRGQVLTSRL